MRSRFALTETPDRLAAVFGATASSTTGWKPSYKFGPARKIIIVRNKPRPSAEPAVRELITATWGFTPVWHSGELPPIIRVGMERLGSNGYFRESFVQRRCLVPMLGYYDWTETPGGARETYFVRGEPPVIAAMGIFNARQQQGRARLSVALVTHDTGAPGDDRVPSVLDESDWEAWLNPASADADDLRERLGERSVQFGEQLTRHRVSESINSPYARDSASLIAPLRTRGESQRSGR